MDLQLLSKGLDLCKKRKKWVFLLALFGASGYGSYRIYRLPSVTRKRRRLFKLLAAFFSVVEMVSDSAETIGVVSRDLKQFMKSDSDEIPNSLRQISKIAMSDEFSDSLSRISEALTVGILRGYQSEISNEGGSRGNRSFMDQIMDKILSNAGTGFVSVVAGSFARYLVLGVYSNGESVDSSDGNRMANVLDDGVDIPGVPRWVTVICSDNCKQMMANCIQLFVSTAVAVYLDKTMDINTYDEIFSGLTNPNHESKVRDLLVSVCNGAVETLVKTSHHVLTSDNMNSDRSSSSSRTFADHSECTNLDRCEFVNGNKMSTHLEDRQVSHNSQGSVFGSMVLSTLSVPSNRRLVLDMTGRVTIETFRSVVGFLLSKLSDGLRRSSGAVHDRVIDRGLQVVRYFGLKSYVLVTICLALFLHIICGTRALLPA